MSAPFLHTVPKGIRSGEVEGSATAAQLADIDCQMVLIQAKTDNGSYVYIGGPGVTVPDGTADTTAGIGLGAGDFSPWLPIQNLNELYYICTDADQDFIYFCIL